MSAVTPYDWAIIAFVSLVAFLCVFMLCVPVLLGGKAWGRAKQEQFESGVVSAGGARIRLSAKFYLVAIFFVVFDIEALYLYAWASAVREVDWFGYVTVLIFVLELLVGLVYAHAVGALNWSPADRKKAVGIKPLAGGSTINLADVTRFDSIDELVRDPTGKIPAQSAQKSHLPTALPTISVLEE